MLMLVARPAMTEAARENRAQAPLGVMAYDRALAEAERVAGRPRAQAEIHVLADLAVGGIEAVQRLEWVAPHAEVGACGPAVLAHVAFLVEAPQQLEALQRAGVR
jgi:hypothetical protein